MTGSVHVSPSQVDLWFGCKRRWAFRYILGLKTDDTAATLFGRLVHGQLENYASGISLPDNSEAGKVARPALAVIPQPSPLVVPEREVRWTSPSGVPWLFLKDLEAPGGQVWNTATQQWEPDPRGKVCQVWDYKTFSRAEFNKTPEYLRDKDPQGIVYAAHSYLTYSPSVVRLSWLYLAKTGARRCLPVVVEPAKSHCLDRFDWIESEAHVMLGHRARQTDPMSLPPSAGYCRAYGKQCEFSDRCNLSDNDKVWSLMNQTVPKVDNAAFLADIASLGRGGTPTPQPAAVAPIPPPAFQNPPVDPQTLVVPETRARRPWDPPETSAQTQAATAAAVAIAGPSLAAGAPQSVVMPEPPPPFVPPTLPQPAPTPEKPKRHRRTKAEMEADRARAAAAGQPAPVEETDEPITDQEIDRLPNAQDYARTGPSEPEPPDTARLEQKVIERWTGTAADPDSFRDRLILSLASNPGLVGCPACDLVNRADAILGARG